MVTILSSYQFGITPANTPTGWKVKTNTYLKLANKKEAQTLAKKMHDYVQLLFSVERKLSAKVAQMTTEQLKRFDAQAAFKAELNSQPTP